MYRKFIFLNVRRFSGQQISINFNYHITHFWNMEQNKYFCKIVLKRKSEISKNHILEIEKIEENEKLKQLIETYGTREDQSVLHVDFEEMDKVYEILKSYSDQIF
jgi:hypothetical protein